MDKDHDTSLSILVEALTGVVGPRKSDKTSDEPINEITGTSNLEERLANWGSD